MVIRLSRRVNEIVENAILYLSLIDQISLSENGLCSSYDVILRVIPRFVKVLLSFSAEESVSADIPTILNFCYL